MKKFTKALLLVLALAMTLSLVACANDDAKESDTESKTEAPTESATETPTETETETQAPTETETETEAPTETETEAPKEDPTIKGEGVLTYAEFLAAEVDKEVVIEAYIQDTQIYSEKYGNTTLYLQDADGAYFVYRVKCTAEEAAKFTIGTKVKVTGKKATWNGEVEITDPKVEVLEGNYIFDTKDMTANFANEEELMKVQNQKVIFKGVKVEASKIKDDETDYAWLYKYNGTGKEGDDLYIKLSLNGKTYSFCVESDLRNADSDAYKAVKNLKVGDTIDVEGFLYWYNAPQLHITNVIVK